MVKSKGFLLVIGVLVISCGAFPTSDEHPLKRVETEAERAADAYSTDRIRREVAAAGQLDLTIAAKEGAQKDLTPPPKDGTPDDFAPPTIECIAKEALTEEELSELARCGFGGFGGGFNRPIIFPGVANPPGFIDVTLSRGSGLNTNNRPAINWLALLRLLG